MKIKDKILLIIFACFSIFSCTKTEDTANVEMAFTKIINQNDFSNAISAQAIVETSNGYLILASNQIPNEQFPNIVLVNIDKKGKFVSENKLESKFVCATKELFKNGAGYRFICMDALSSRAIAIDVDAEGKITATQTLEITYPLASAIDTDGGYLIQGFSQENRTTVVHKYNTAMGNIWKKEFFIFETVDEIIFGHLTNTGKKYAFAVGNQNGNYYYNGFRNFTFATLFFANGSLNQTGVANGYRYSAGINGILPLDGNNFAVSRFNSNQIVFNPRLEINPNQIISISSISGRTMLEIDPNALVSIKKLTLNGKNIAIFASNTIQNQIAIYAYDNQTGNLLGSEYYGFSIACEFSDIITTNDGGLMMLGSAFVEGRFKRICMIKLAKSQTEAILN